jgi:dolichol kinase
VEPARVRGAEEEGARVVKSELLRELGRKAFHQLSLVYLGVFFFFGWPRAGVVMGAWLAIVLVIETARLKIPAIERALVGLFDGMIRETERKHFSGIFHTTIGSLGAMLIASGDSMIVSAAILQLALADSASALVGKAFGRTKLFGGVKSLEGSLGGLAVGFAAALACGVRPGAALAAALAGALAELLPTTPWCNDNLWIPVVSATVLRLAGAR